MVETARRYLGAAVSVIALSVAGHAAAQTPPAPAGPQAAPAPDPRATDDDLSADIVVTAQKRSESLQKVPLSVQVLTGARLEGLRISTVDELPLLSPSVAFTNSTNTRGQGLSVRGVGTINFSDGVEPSVSTVIDGVVLGRQAMSVFELIDLDRVEILRGPQGTLFGKNSSAGVLNLVTQRPSQTFSVTGSASYATLNEVKLRGSVTGPLIPDVLSARLTGYYVRRDGYIHNVYDNSDLNNRDQFGLRGKLLLTPSPSVDILVIGDYAEINQRCCAFTPISIAPTVRHFGTLRSTLTLPVIPGPDNDEVNLDGPYFLHQKSGGGSIEANVRVGAHTITSITAYRTFSVYDNNDPDGVPINLLNLNDAVQDQRQFTQELRLTSPKDGTLEYVVGGFFFDQRVASMTHVAGTFGAVAAPNVLGSLVDRAIDTQNFAGFGQATLHLTRQFGLIAGARYTDERLDARFFRSNLPGAVGPASGNGPPLSVPSIGSRDTAWSYRLGAQYEPTNNLLLFATYAKGYKGAALNLLNNLTAALVTANRAVVPPEIPTNVEGGVRSSFFNRRVSVNITGFHTVFKNFQATAFDASQNATILTTAGKLRTQGVELEVLANPTRGLSLFGNGAYTDAMFTDFPAGPCYNNQANIVGGGCVAQGLGFIQNLRGKRLNNSPRWAFSVGGNYRGDLGGNGLGWFVNANYVYRSEVNFSLSQDPNTIQPGFGLVNGALGLTGRGERWKLSVFTKNLFDKSFANLIFASPFDGGGARAVAGYSQIKAETARRTVGVALDFKL